MPEGDTVYRAARLLDRSLSGRMLTRTDFRVPQHATADLAGATVVETVSRGKHLLTRIDGAPDGEQLLGAGSTPLREALQAAGFLSTPRGLRLRA